MRYCEYVLPSEVFIPSVKKLPDDSACHFFNDPISVWWEVIPSRSLPSPFLNQKQTASPRIRRCDMIRRFFRIFWGQEMCQVLLTSCHPQGKRELDHGTKGAQPNGRHNQAKKHKQTAGGHSFNGSNLWCQRTRCILACISCKFQPQQNDKVLSVLGLKSKCSIHLMWENTKSKAAWFRDSLIVWLFSQ